MLRSEFYRQLEEARKLCETEKAVFRERIVSIESQRAREEGRRIQLETQLGIASGDVVELRKRLAESSELAARDAAAARQELELLITSVDRLERELTTTRAALARYEAESTVLLFDDIFFEAGSSSVSNEDKARLKAAQDELRRADQISVVGFTDNRERGFGYGLGAARAGAVAAYLRRNTFVTAPINVISRGADDPKNPNATVEGRARNRRVEIIAVYKAE